MYYLNLINQLHLILVLAGSAWLFALSTPWSYDEKAIRVAGVAHAAPFLLTALAFITAPADRNNTAFLAWFAGLAAAVLLIPANLTVSDPNRARKVELATWFFPIPVLLLKQWVPLQTFRIYGDALMTAALALGVLLLSMKLVQREKRVIERKGGTVLLVAGFVLFEVSWFSWLKVPSLVLLAAGYALTARWLWRNTTERLRVEKAEYERTMERINQNINREVVKRVEVIEKSNRKLLEITKTDNLTGAYTKAAIMNTIDTMVTRAPNAMFSLILFDLDHFKTINDTQGHPVGDRCLKQLASIARGSFRSEDMIGRYGGDEFMILLPGANPLKAGMVAERFRQNVEKGSGPSFTVSIGIATFPQDAQNPRGLVEAADRALYISKKRGRNAVTHISQMTQEQEQEQRQEGRQGDRRE